MIDLTSKNECTGCQACRLLCPNHCITMDTDDAGFQIPLIDRANCADCGLCVSRCPESSRMIFPQNDCIKVLAARRYIDDKLLSKSSSGGVFVGIARKVLETPGNAVFGCAFDANMVARHICVTDIKDIAPLQSSKYVQSDTGDTYLQTRTLLEEGKTVFYTGTPCQIAGLYAFLEKDYDNLLTADLICHGVPSPLLFKRYINRLSKKFGENVINYNFRSKDKNGWGLNLILETETRTKAIMWQTDPYYLSFLENRTLRECCYICKYASHHRVADITLGDFWGIELEHPEFYDRSGVSVILVNTTKGDNFFETVYNDFDIIESDFEKVVKKNMNLRKPSPRSKLRDIAYKNIWNENIDVFKGPAYKINKKAYMKAYLKKTMPFFLIKTIKKIKSKIRKA